MAKQIDGSGRQCNELNEIDAVGSSRCDHDGGLETIELKVPEDLYRAFQRCTWILVNETGRSRLNIMEEVVEDFLIKNGC